MNINALAVELIKLEDILLLVPTGSEECVEINDRMTHLAEMLDVAFEENGFV